MTTVSIPFAVWWTIGCILVGWVLSFWVLRMCQVAHDADVCAECLQRRMDIEHMKTKRHSTRSAAALPPATDPLRAERPLSGPLLSPCCGAPIVIQFRQDDVFHCTETPICYRCGARTIPPPPSKPTNKDATVAHQGNTQRGGEPELMEGSPFNPALATATVFKPAGKPSTACAD